MCERVCLFILLSALCHSLVEKVTGCPTLILRKKEKCVVPFGDDSIYEICKFTGQELITAICSLSGWKIPKAPHFTSCFIYIDVL